MPSAAKRTFVKKSAGPSRNKSRIGAPDATSRRPSTANVVAATAARNSTKGKAKRNATRTIASTAASGMYMYRYYMYILE